MSNDINDFAELVVSMPKTVKILSTPHSNAKKLVELMESDSFEGDGEIGELYHKATQNHQNDGSVLVLFRNSTDDFFITTSLDLSASQDELADDNIYSFPLNESNDSFIRNCYWF